MQGKAGRSPPGCPPRRLEIIANWSVNLIGSLASIESGNLFACAPAGCSSCTSRRTPRSRGRHANSSQMRGLGGRSCPRNRSSRQRPSRDRKTNFRSFIYSRSSTISANWVKIGPVDVQIIGLTESLYTGWQWRNFDASWLSPPSCE